MWTVATLAFGLVAANASSLDEKVREAATMWANGAGVQLEILEVEAAPAPGCDVGLVDAPPNAPASGSSVFRLREASGGRVCGYARVRVALLEPVLVLLHDVPAGAPLAGAVREELRPAQAHHRAAKSLPKEAVAQRPMDKGEVLLVTDAQVPGPATGERVDVLWRRGTLRLATHGVVIPCRRQETNELSPVVCVRLPTGKRVEGAFLDGRVLVEAP